MKNNRKNRKRIKMLERKLLKELHDSIVVQLKSFGEYQIIEKIVFMGRIDPLFLKDK